MARGVCWTEFSPRREGGALFSKGMWQGPASRARFRSGLKSATVGDKVCKASRAGADGTEHARITVGGLGREKETGRAAAGFERKARHADGQITAVAAPARSNAGDSICLVPSSVLGVMKRQLMRSVLTRM